MAELAERQSGVVARWQLVALGISEHAIDRRVAGKRLLPIHRGVYAVGHSSLRLHGRWTAAVLACGRRAVLSHRDAAALWGIRGTARAKIDVTAPGRTRSGLPGIDLHLVRRLAAEDRTIHERVPVTTVARTLFDLAEVLPPPALEGAFDEANSRDLFDLKALEGVMRRNPGRRAHRPLRALIPRLSETPQITRSVLERCFLHLCREAGIPMPTMNAWIAGYEVDALWAGRRLVVELDGFAFHRTRSAFERDRVKAEALQLAGFTVLRFTYRRLLDDPGGVIRTLRRFLDSS
jgi:uncharacterized protein DUF559/putative AbiEi antitoxin of type IV toxin-antitoxin system